MNDLTKLSHLDQYGRAQMVDIGAKSATERVALAGGSIYMQSKTLHMIRAGKHAKGDVFTVAKIAGIQAAKRCADLLPLCHSLLLTAIDVRLTADEKSSSVYIESSCRLSGKTGAEMEALTAVSVAALTIYDMCKAVDKDMIIQEIRLIEKRGGKSDY